ncbi:hypothetical protein thalar_03133 [Litoreibacter arenae DSM 19593]|uniref:Uncharacterized protein n=1 Tax=Litoreibacter arenae DSM 19593 TaxID=1123360 RepID=S9RH42_9RHOB|nr:hypothetical protein thalar_03133 [Litoreibacter arenae DSM 19593]
MCVSFVPNTQASAENCAKIHAARQHSAPFGCVRRCRASSFPAVLSLDVPRLSG